MSKNVFLYLTALVFLTGLMSQDHTRLAITNAVVVDGEGGAPLENGTVIINGDRIQAVGPTQQIEIPPDARVIDAMGKTVLPGLADMHVHLLGGWDVVGAVLGAVVGVFFGAIGLVLGPILGSVLGELLRSRKLKDSLRSAFGTGVGMLLGVVAKLSLAVVMVGLVLWWIWNGTS